MAAVQTEAHAVHLAVVDQANPAVQTLSTAQTQATNVAVVAGLVSLDGTAAEQ